MNDGDNSNARRSSRVLARLPVSLGSVKTGGMPFDVTGETLIVSKHGALVRTTAPLRVGDYVRITLSEEQRSQLARVAWLDPKHKRGVAKLLFGIELSEPENFWGVHFPPGDWNEAESWDQLPDDYAHEEEESSPAPAAEKPVSGPAPTSPAALDPVPFEVPADGADAFVRGLSTIRIPFQERTPFVPLSERTATVLVHPVVDIGTLAQIIFPQPSLHFRVRFTAASDRRHGDRWKMWVEIVDPVCIVIV